MTFLVKCCKGGDPCPPGECLEHAATFENTCPYTYELLAAMYDQVQDRGDGVSTTSVTGKCARQEFLKRRTTYVVEPGGLWAAFRGTMFHGRLEQYAHHRSVPEARYFAEVPGCGPFSGSPDLVDPWQGVLLDYKFTNEVPVYDYAWKEHVAQVQVNRWLVDHATHVEYPKGEVHDLTDTNERWRFVPRVWNALMVVYMDNKRVKPITITRSESVEKKNGDGWKKVRVPDIWDDDRVLDLITANYSVLREALDSDTIPPIPETHAEWKHPLCNFCEVRSACIKEVLTGEWAEVDA